MANGGTENDNGGVPGGLVDVVVSFLKLFKGGTPNPGSYARFQQQLYGKPNVFGPVPSKPAPPAPPPISGSPAPPSAGEPYRGPPVPAPGPSVEPYRGPPRAPRKKRKLTRVEEWLKQQLYREAEYYASNPTALLQVLPAGRTGMRVGRTGVRRSAVLERFPPSFQRGSIGALPSGQLRRAAPPRARRSPQEPVRGRIGQQRPRRGPTPTQPTGAPVAIRPAAGARAPAAGQRVVRSPAEERQILRNLPVQPGEDFEPTPAQEDAPNVGNAPRRIPSPAPRRESRPGTVRPGTNRSPGTARATARVPAGLRAAVSQGLLEGVLRAATRRTPRVPKVGSAPNGGIPLPIGDFPAASPAPIVGNAPFLGFATGLKPFPVPKEALDKCNCRHGKKRESKPRKLRTICKAGSYVQTARGIRYSPNREVPCDISPVKRVKEKIARKVRKKLKPGQFPMFRFT